MEYIEIDKDNIPESFYIDLADETFKLKFAYNETSDYFTVDLYQSNEDGEDIEMVMGEKLVLNKPLWSDISNLSLPAPQLVPIDLSNNEKRITWDNLGETVFLYINDEIEGEDDGE